MDTATGTTSPTFSSAEPHPPLTAAQWADLNDIAELTSPTFSAAEPAPTLTAAQWDDLEELGQMLESPTRQEPRRITAPTVSRAGKSLGMG